MELTEFLLARIAEDEAEARRGVGWSDTSTRWGRVLVESDAKRRIVEQFTEQVRRQELNVEKSVRAASLGDHEAIPNLRSHGWQLDGRVTALRFVLITLATPYADHPDYNAEWKP